LPPDIPKAWLDVHAREEARLAPYAARSRKASRPGREDGPPPLVRTAYQEDLYRIVHTRAFRRLAHKTQALCAATGDHPRSRLTHTLEVSQIARSVSRALGLNEDLSEAVAMGHDLGHAPFGHAGEKALDSLVPGGFTHQAQSLRIVDTLANGGTGLNLTNDTRDGILKHSKGLGPVFARGADSPATLEGQVVRVSDIIAYLAHDMDDALEEGLLSPGAVPVSILSAFGESSESRENAMVKDLLENTAVVSGKPRFAFSRAMEASMGELRDFMLSSVYRSPLVTRQMTEGAGILKEIYLALMSSKELYDEIPYKHLMRKREEAARDFIAGMTDRFAMKFVEKVRNLPRTEGSQAEASRADGRA
jgi:dGTPase